MYTAIVLDEESRQKLIRRFINHIPSSYEIIAHHMTINMGTASKGLLIEKEMVGKTADMFVTSIARSDKVIAVRVNTKIPSVNKIKHITLAVDRNNGGKPVMSNKLNNWSDISDPFVISGKIKEVA